MSVSVNGKATVSEDFRVAAILPVGQWVYRVGHWLRTVVDAQEVSELIVDLHTFQVVKPLEDAYLVDNPAGDCFISRPAQVEDICDFVQRHWQRLQRPSEYMRISRRANKQETSLSLVELIRDEFSAIRFCIAYGLTEFTHAMSGRVIDLSKVVEPGNEGVLVGWIDSVDQVRMRTRKKNSISH